jgi:hypothetical protein
MTDLTSRRHNGPWEPATDIENNCDYPSCYTMFGRTWATSAKPYLARCRAELNLLARNIFNGSRRNIAP